MLAWSVSVEAVDSCLVKDADLVLADRLMCALNNLVKTLPKEDKARLCDRIRCVR
jgi:hypothetical protein